jgi:hypothetical protein
MSRAETPDERSDPLARTQPLDFDAGREDGCQGHTRAVNAGTETLIRTIDERGHFRVLLPDSEDPHDCLLVRVPGEEHHGWCDCKGFRFGEHPCAHLFAVRMAEVMNDADVPSVSRSDVEGDGRPTGPDILDLPDPDPPEPEADPESEVDDSDDAPELTSEPEFEPKSVREPDSGGLVAEGPDGDGSDELAAESDSEPESAPAVPSAPTGPGYAIIRDVGRVDSEAFQINGNGWLVANPGDDSETWFPPHRVVKVRPYGGGPGDD